MSDTKQSVSLRFGRCGGLGGATAGQKFLLFAGPVPALPADMPHAHAEKLPPLKAGHLLRGEREEHRVLGRFWWPGIAGVADQPSAPCWLLETLVPAPSGADDVRELALSRNGFALAWITLSDKGAAGLRADASGPLIEELTRAEMPLSLARGFVLPDEERQLAALLAQLALVDGFDFICTTGGTGVAPRDVTPEATLRVIEKRLPGFERAMTLASLAKTPRGAVSRAVCGTLGGAVVVNLPGSPKAVRECLGAVLPAVAHTIEKLQGDPSECGAD
ncbi:MAG TPA: MogA/MoaB family molybdenum cofactor biosynthesis protein [Humidesulfovibrio sp.]|uniref:MogA/MoaB family molybdenum cofactor biosynthesis protein n=1 Tax=Humidesulfovibrio sp. TaxID=2910988 RepID=UPI002BDD3386|nr:MogA/MoaB family molybdenum cofactor biosynthesis protein [Humidesulfovibrio sp.]HWR03698.1 MogA/MoaB family molybdenum cofactor biosynthesis protein [Humidesulfovibrio sp.]